MKATLLLAGLLLFIGGCLPDENRFELSENRDVKKAIILYSGAPETDGCGWLIQVGDIVYHPENLAGDFKVESLSVWIRYHKTKEKFRCGRGGVSYETIRILRMESIKNTNEVGILQKDQWETLKMDSYRMGTVYVDGDSLRIKVSYSGGCTDHTFQLWKLPPNALVPPPVELLLDHDSHGDPCEAWLTRWLSFSLRPIRINGKHEVPFLMRGSPEMSSYFGTFVYKY